VVSAEWGGISPETNLAGGIFGLKDVTPTTGVFCKSGKHWTYA
jgi:hypothetical protein